MRIRETWIDATREAGIGESGWYEPYTDDRGELFRAMQREYGGCVSKVYREVPQGDASANPGVAAPAADRQAIVTETGGWVFSKRQQYTDSNATYVAETWVEVDES
jgi:hypothetical protein